MGGMEHIFRRIFSEEKLHDFYSWGFSLCLILVSSAPVESDQKVWIADDQYLPCQYEDPSVPVFIDSLKDLPLSLYVEGATYIYMNQIRALVCEPAIRSTVKYIFF